MVLIVSAVEVKLLQVFDSIEEEELFLDEQTRRALLVLAGEEYVEGRRKVLDRCLLILCLHQGEAVVAPFLAVAILAGEGFRCQLQ